jgi:hypothetical protein
MTREEGLAAVSRERSTYTTVSTFPSMNKLDNAVVVRGGSSISGEYRNQLDRGSELGMDRQGRQAEQASLLRSSSGGGRRMQQHDNVAGQMKRWHRQYA